MTLVQKMFLFWRGQTLSCPLPWWRHSWYRPVVIVYPHKPQPSRPHPYSSRWTQTSQTSTLTHPAHPWMMTPSKYNHSNTDTAINCPTYSTSSNGASITLQRERESTSKNTWTALPIYRGHSNSQRLAQDGSSSVGGSEVHNEKLIHLTENDK